MYMSNPVFSIITDYIYILKYVEKELSPETIMYIRNWRSEEHWKFTNGQKYWDKARERETGRTYGKEDVYK